MSAQSDGPYGPLTPMPELTPDALRAAVARIARSRVPALTQHLFEATTNAQQTRTGTTPHPAWHRRRRPAT
ncbi:hypothetical protein QF026_003751 [Streptomyces aurantiacus]|uniref:hypothetical protein n=1 Tax=Streptomyces aurantiacus TaxID=47760 RepID=UPI00279352CD|nr:hypothetical protein [Streptomyces aurantiacus]MDQ0775285.1 hypothetical protein [Streptomyces aurantiacus]